MARPQRQRTVCFEPVYSCFCPKGVAETEKVTLTVDEFEALRLVDFLGKSHEEAARQMKISRTTATEIYQSARYKVADSLVNGKQLCIAGGSYRLCSGDAETCTEPLCKKRKNLKIPQKGYNIMRIAIPYQNEEIFQHFGHSEAFKFYDAADNTVCASCVVPTNGSGHGALAFFLQENGVDVLLCGGIGGGAKDALAKAGIRVFGGVKGRADDAAAAFLAGTLHYDPEAHCSHHHAEGHSCGENHTCGEHGCH